MAINDIILSSGVGVLLALILALPAIVGEMRRRHKGHFLLPDVHHAWGKRKLKDREVFALGLLVHLCMGLVFGALYPYFAGSFEHLIRPYGALSLFVFALLYYVIATLIVMPLFGIGVFGRKEDGLIWLELIVTLVLLSVGYFYAVAWFQPSWFQSEWDFDEDVYCGLTEDLMMGLEDCGESGYQ